MNTLKVVLILAGFSLLFMWGCGGRISETAGTTYTGDSIPITINTGASSNSVVFSNSAAKDIGGTARVDVEGGDVNQPNENMVVSCDVEFEPDDGLTSVTGIPVVALTAAGWEADCVAAGKSINKCIACRVNVMAYDTYNSTDYAKDCRVECQGMVPNVPETQTDKVDMVVTFTTMFDVTNTLDPAGVLFRQDGQRTDEYYDYVNQVMGSADIWDESDLSIEGLINEAGTGYSLCDGTGGTMVMTAVDPLDTDDLFSMDACPSLLETDESCIDADWNTPMSWRKNFTVSAMGDGRCIMDTAIETNVPLGIPTAGQFDLQRAAIKLGATWCDDKTNCAAIGGAETFDLISKLASFSDAKEKAIVDGATEMDLSWVELSFLDNTILASSVNSNNVSLSVIDASLSQPGIIYEVMAEGSPYTQNLGILVDNAAEFQLNEMRLNVNDLIIVEADIQYLQEVGLSYTLTNSCALSDYFHRDDTLVTCASDAIVVANDLAATTTTINDMISAEAITNTIDLTHSQQNISEAGFGVAGTLEVLAMSKDDMSASGWQWEVQGDLINIANFDDTNLVANADFFETAPDADAVLGMVRNPNSGYGYAIGLMKGKDSFGAPQTYCIAVSFSDPLEGSAIEVTGGWKYECGEFTDIKFKLEYSDGAIAYIDTGFGWDAVGYTEMATDFKDITGGDDRDLQYTYIGEGSVATIAVFSSSVGLRNFSFSIDQYNVRGFDSANYIEESVKRIEPVK